MDIYEEVVLKYITSNESRFVNPQYDIAYDESDDIGGRLPDFVVLDFSQKTIFIVEVTKAYNIKGLLSRVKEKETGWIKPIKKSIDAIFKDWEYHITLFLRDDRIEYAKKIVKKYNDVSVISLKNTNDYLGNNTGEAPLKI